MFLYHFISSIKPSLCRLHPFLPNSSSQENKQSLQNFLFFFKKMFIHIIIAGLFMLCFLLWYACRCCMQRRLQRQTHVVHIADTRTTTTSAATTTTGGLDQRAIDAIPSIIIGESGRMIKQDDKTCSICLSEYEPNEKLKILPHCLHRFHSDCIDQWLQSNGTCPICRVPPPLDSYMGL